MVSFVQRKLQECLRDHSYKCGEWSARGEPQRPARLLEVENDAVRLVGFDSNTMADQYAALSYCWGSSEELELHPPFTTKISNIEELRQAGIALSNLPLTIKKLFGYAKSLKYVIYGSTLFASSKARQKIGTERLQGWRLSTQDQS
jgi:hypothetical protein